jgi:hypothetical protein
MSTWQRLMGIPRGHATLQIGAGRAVEYAAAIEASAAIGDGAP